MAIGSTIGNVGEAALAVVQDPYLPRVTQLLLDMRDAEASAPSGVPREPGIGLRHAVLPLEIFVGARKHPLIAIGVVFGILGGLYYLGYASGKERR